MAEKWAKNLKKLPFPSKSGTGYCTSSLAVSIYIVHKRIIKVGEGVELLEAAEPARK